MRTNPHTAGFTLIEILIITAILGILSAIAIPTYHAYISRTEAHSGLRTLASAKNLIDSAIANGNPSPTLTVVGIPENSTIGDIELNFMQGNGTGHITFTFNDATTPAIRNTSITLTRDASGAWSCSTTIAIKYKPTHCH